MSEPYPTVGAFSRLIFCFFLFDEFGDWVETMTCCLIGSDIGRFVA